jgi:class 3 adenylate cyclase
VEGSTPLARRLGDDWPVLLQALWLLIRRSLRASGGEEVDIRGDEYFAVFRRPADAVRGAIRAQLAIARHAWPAGANVKVRMGLHTGRPTIADAAYVGITVHTVARVCSAGHGGQVLLSSSTYAAVSSPPSDDLAYRELGRYRLAGLAQPEPLYQLIATGLTSEFPRLRARLAPTRSRVAANL